MNFKNFSLAIQGKVEDDHGYVRMAHQEEYTVVMRNGTDRRVDAMLLIDGTEVGTFRLSPYGEARIERPADEARKFTFLKLDSLDARQIGLDSIPAEDLGLVQVVFKPEMNLPAPVKRSWRDHASPYFRGSTLSSTSQNTIECCAGGTGLGEKSDQSFFTVSDLKTLQSDWVQISLRLTLGGKYAPLKNSTTVPKPIF